MDQQQTLVDRYQLRERLGVGGMGRVWLARDEQLMRDVAIKQVAKPVGLNPADTQRARRMAIREAQAASQINHPNAVRIYDIVHDAGWPWIVMEYVPSESLRSLIKRCGPCTPAYTATIGLAVLEALTAAHRAGVLHRDVTPGNVLIGDDRRIVLADFGLAAWNPYDGRTIYAGTMGSPNYVAPERVRSGISIPEGDLWSLGATMYAAVEGRAPYERTNVLETLAALVTLPPDPPRRAGALTTVLCGLIQRDPKVRMGTPEARRHLENVINARPDDALTQRIRTPRRQRLQSAQTVCLAPASARPHM
jgi:eukaryotic-like serine/threonine-protein kinase